MMSEGKKARRALQSTLRKAFTLSMISCLKSIIWTLCAEQIVRGQDLLEEAGLGVNSSDAGER